MVTCIWTINTPTIIKFKHSCLLGIHTQIEFMLYHLPGLQDAWICSCGYILNCITSNLRRSIFPCDTCCLSSCISRALDGSTTASAQRVRPGLCCSMHSGRDKDVSLFRLPKIVNKGEEVHSLREMDIWLLFPSLVSQTAF